MYHFTEFTCNSFCVKYNFEAALDFRFATVSCYFKCAVGLAHCVSSYCSYKTLDTNMRHAKLINGTPKMELR